MLQNKLYLNIHEREVADRLINSCPCDHFNFSSCNFIVTSVSIDFFLQRFLSTHLFG